MGSKALSSLVHLRKYCLLLTLKFGYSEKATKYLNYTSKHLNCVASEHNFFKTKQLRSVHTNKINNRRHFHT